MPRAKMNEERRFQILAALELCIVEQGLAKTSLNDVAERAGLARPLVRHFVGNRDNMVKLLFQSLIDRGEAQLNNIAEEGDQPNLHHMLDLLFGDLFSNTVSNVVVSELWSLARNSDEIQVRLRSLYDRIFDLLIVGMKAEGYGASRQERRDTAFCIVSTAYGHASFREIGLSSKNKNAPRIAANTLLADIKSKS